MTPVKHRKSRRSPRILKKIKIITRLVYWGQEKLFEEKKQSEKSGDTVPLSSASSDFSRMSGERSYIYSIISVSGAVFTVAKFVIYDP
jgi:hypothetical protein